MSKVVGLRRAALCGVVLLAGASATARAGSPVRITNDKFEPLITAVGPEVVFKLDGAEFAELFFRSWVDKKTKAVTHQLFLTVEYVDDGWRFYNAAFDDRTTEHAVTMIEHTVDHCGEGLFSSKCDYWEKFGVEVSDAQMRDYAKSGVEFKIKANSGVSYVVAIKPTLVTEQLAALDGFVADGYKIDQSQLPMPELGLAVLDYGNINRKLYFGLDRGLKITGVDPGSVGEASGIKKGDWLLDFAGSPLKSKADLTNALSKLTFGQSVSATIKRDGAITAVTLQFGAPAPAHDGAAHPPSPASGKSG